MIQVDIPVHRLISVVVNLKQSLETLRKNWGLVPGSGHGPNRNSTQGAFPDTWTDDQEIAAIERIANNPDSTWKQSSGPGYQTAPVSVGGPAPQCTSINE